MRSLINGQTFPHAWLQRGSYRSVLEIWCCEDRIVCQEWVGRDSCLERYRVVSHRLPAVIITLGLLLLEEQTVAYPELV